MPWSHAVGVRRETDAHVKGWGFTGESHVMLAKGAALHVFFPGGLPVRLNVREVTSGLRGLFPAIPVFEHACVVR